MPIQRAQPLSAGDAVRLFLTLPSGASFTRILRKTADSFTGANDPGAFVVIDDCASDAVLDLDGLVNGTEYFYRSYDWIASAYVDSGVSVSATPAASYIGDDVDPQELVRDRIQLGLNVEVGRGALVPETGSIKVTTAPFALADGISLPTVSVHLQNTGPADRGLGEHLEDFFDPEGATWTDRQGWNARFSLSVVGVSWNPDERIALRKALRRIIQANLSVFAAAGLTLIEFQQSDSEQFQEQNAALYYTNGTFSCHAPAYVQHDTGAITDVTIAATEFPV